MSSAAYGLHDAHRNSVLHPVVCLEYPAFHDDGGPLGFGDSQMSEQVFDRRPVRDLDLDTLCGPVAGEALTQSPE